MHSNGAQYDCPVTKKGESAATILDVARRAGVSRTTVSRVLNEPDKVTADTLKRVTDAATALRYAPSSVARGLRSGRTGLIALLVGDISQPFHGSLAQAVAAASEKRGLGVMLYDLGHSTSRLEDVLHKLQRQQVDGLIIATADNIATPQVRSAIEDCLAQGMAVVTSIEQFGLSEVIAVDLDHRQGARLASEALSAAGYHATALVLGDSASPISRRIIEGAGAAHVIDAAYSFEATADAVRELPGDVDSLIVSTLPMALGARAGLAASGRDLPIIVCEDVPLAAHVHPSFTTSAVSPEPNGEEMVRLIDAALKGTPVDHHRLVPALVRRESF